MNNLPQFINNKYTLILFTSCTVHLDNIKVFYLLTALKEY